MNDNSLPWQNINDWLSSMSSLLGEISTVEISTVIVDEIIEDVFLPYEVYQAIYLISPAYLIELAIHPSLRDRYLRLRRQLELQYALLLIDEHNLLYNPQLVTEVQRDLPILAKETASWNSLPCRLPPPTNYGHYGDHGLLSQILSEPNFRSILRQLGEIKESLDRRNDKLNSVAIDNQLLQNNIIYAQTVLQLNGKIVNRYASEIVDHPQQKEILELHKKSLEVGEKQWHKLFKFVAEIVQRQQRYSRTKSHSE